MRTASIKTNSVDLIEISSFVLVVAFTLTLQKYNNFLVFLLLSIMIRAQRGKKHRKLRNFFRVFIFLLEIFTGIHSDCFFFATQRRRKTCERLRISKQISNFFVCQSYKFIVFITC